MPTQPPSSATPAPAGESVAVETNMGAHRSRAASAPGTRQTLASLILQPLILPLLLLAGVAGTVYSGVNRNAQSAALVSASQERMNILSAISRDITSIENGQRGFLITGDRTFMQPYLDGKRDLAQQVERLRRASTIQVQLQNLERLNQKVQLWDQEAGQPEMQARLQSITAASERVKSGKGKRRLDEARALLATMIRNETVRQSEAIRANGATLQNVRAITLLGLGLGMILLFLTALRATQTVTRSVKALNDGAERIAAGHYDLRLPRTGVRELDHLGTQYHRMAEAVQQRQQQLETSTRELKQTNENLERSNRELERFAYVASHDLQEPLRTIGSYTELMAKRYRGQLDERADQYIDFTISATYRLKNLIQDLLAFSRVHRPGRTFAQVDTARLVGEVLQELAAKIANAGASVTVGPLPTVRGNAELLHHMFLNLITNAVKFRSPERPSQVEVQAKRLAAGWEFTVQDNGIGIDQEYREKIFEVFQRLHGVGEYEGSGIGLAVTRSAAEQHGGHLWVESTPGVGSTFHFTLPDHSPEPTTPEHP